MGTTKDEDDVERRGRAGAAAARERALGARERALKEREQSQGTAEGVLDAREVAALEREEAVHLREELVKAREEVASARAASERLLEDLRIANEKLLLLSLDSQALAEAAEAAKARLQESEKELIGAVEVRERVLGIVSHDLRTPLGAISMAVDLLQRNGHLEDRDRELTIRIRGSVARMVEMIAHLLDFARAHRGAGLRISRAQTDLGAVCRRVVEELELQHATPGRFVCDFAGDLRGSWDADRMAQVVANLGGNAIEHGTAGTPIELSVAGADREVRLEVHNQGQPIPAELLPHVFEAFRGAKGRGQAPTHGLGLGLYISDQIVRSHGGSITIRSTAAEGTTFSVRLPRTAGAAGGESP